MGVCGSAWFKKLGLQNNLCMKQAKNYQFEIYRTYYIGDPE